MLKHFFIIVIISCFSCFLFGVKNLFLEVEDNSCRMTYMFQPPQFARVKFRENEAFPNYGLYYYYESNRQKDFESFSLKGAPVIFIPGNGGSFKQVRSLASVALRKSMDTNFNIHFDYFTVDFNEELSGLFGGYLEIQQEFLKQCILNVLKTYKPLPLPKKIVLIGHSMGGKIAQSILTDVGLANNINTIIYISSPLDYPVLNFDTKMKEFYDNVNGFLSKELNVKTNEGKPDAYDNAILNNGWNESISSELRNILTISIGGGNRDLLVPAVLTTSKFNDIHSMTSSIPEVWLSCDHLSSVWCLQLILVINRFLFSISVKDKSGAIFYQDEKTLRMQKALNFFCKSRNRSRQTSSVRLESSENDCTWNENSKRVFRKHFNHGIKSTYCQMLSLSKFLKFRKLYIEVDSNDNNWLYGCTAKLTLEGTHACENETLLSHHIQYLPIEGGKKSVALLDLNGIRKSFMEWTHVVVRLLPTKKPTYLNVDIYNPSSRKIKIKAPRWYNFKNKVLLNETLQGSLLYEVEIAGLDESFQAIEVKVEPLACTKSAYKITTKVHVPWAQGFDRYQTFNEKTHLAHFYVNTPVSAPRGYNTSKYPIVVEVHLDPACRYSISYKFSVACTMSRIVREYIEWIPAHLIAIFIIALKDQNSKFSSESSSGTNKPYSMYFQFSSLYIITGCRILKKLLVPLSFLPRADSLNHSFYVSVIIHSTAIVLAICTSIGFWIAMTLNLGFINNTVLRLFKKIFGGSSMLVSALTMLPLTLGVLAISISISSCSAVGLICGCLFYFSMISNAYEEYMQNWFWKMASNFLMKQRCRNQNQSREGALTSDRNNTPELDHKPSESSEKKMGFNDFAFHTNMLFLLCVQTVLSAGGTVKWIKNYRSSHLLPDPSFWPAVVVLACLSALWQLKAPNKLFTFKATSFILYLCASACIIFCLDNLYRLNFVIAFVFVLVLLQELFGRLWFYFNM